MSDLGDMLAYHIARRMVMVVISVAIFFIGVGFVLGKYI